jgi:hypothetical protein
VVHLVYVNEYYIRFLHANLLNMLSDLVCQLRSDRVRPGCYIVGSGVYYPGFPICTSLQHSYTLEAR